ncbi:hypothetical protein CDAR_494551 [Caerostris darwini]|uniref:Uncharacterized protein n=1 Tax=Caerostris darwini TaxID=1538125 RepID=A0AAV4S7P8_9ARAC|nr:hypothetical protein CDAR_494551 [Caerostris darwini]
MQQRVTRAACVSVTMKPNARNPATDIRRTLFKSPKYARLIKKLKPIQDSDCCDAPQTTQPILEKQLMSVRFLNSKDSITTFSSQLS